MNRKFLFFLIKYSACAALALMLVVLTNYCIDASSIIRPMHTQMARLALAGHTVKVPENYNERAYQVCIVNEMNSVPGTVVIGSSRGMFLGRTITGIDDLYNHCVSGACLEDDYALLGLYYQKFGQIPRHIILEVSPWIFYSDNPEARWKEKGAYLLAASAFYAHVNGTNLSTDIQSENPYLSVSYFQYNIGQLLKCGVGILQKTQQAQISENAEEAADYPDGSIRYSGRMEKESAERLSAVQKQTGPCTYKNVHLMTEIGVGKKREFENLVNYLLAQGCEIELYLQPFSVTQCVYSFDRGENPGFSAAEEYLRVLSAEKNITLIGGYDARKFDLRDDQFMDSIHLDRNGVTRVWNYPRFSDGTP